MKKISFVIPCYNSEKMIEVVVNGIISEIENKYNYRIILVNDCSKDNTWKVISSLCDENKNIVGINLSQNYGQQAARLAALPYADGEYTVFMNDDGEHPAYGIEKLILKVEEGYDIAYAYFRRKKESKFKKFGSVVNRWMTEIVMHKPRNVNPSSFFVARKYVVDSLKEYKSPFAYTFGYLMTISKNIADVEIEQQERLSGKTGYTFNKLLHLWLDGFTGFSVLPLKISSCLGALSATSAFIFAIAILVKKILNPNMAVGYASTIIVVLFIGGIILLMLGLLGEYIGRILVTLNNIPQYVVKERINDE
ncbi:MAG: glycosyltransferase [Clostridium sp.]|nr:glycosyltransferase [Clostridium sp.]